MGFTRNYKNILMANLCNVYKKADTTISTSAFDDSTYLTVKDTSGVIQRYLPLGSQGLNRSDDITQNGSALNTMTSLQIGLLIGTNGYSGASYGNKILRFGSNDAEETIDDYTINKITVSFSLNPKLVSTSYIDKKSKHNYECVITSTSDATINEFGIVAPCRTPSGSNSDRNSTNGGDEKEVLLYRKKLDTPIELKANEPQLVTFDIEQNYPA